MTLTQKLFGTSGRLRRMDYWLLSIATNIVVAIASALLNVLLGQPPISQEISPGDVFSLASIWISIALMVKRCHDRDKAWWWVLIFMIPIVGWIWGLIELGFLDGTQGPNRFGPSPKGIGGSGEELTAQVFS
jgi:uncharacterized membrane protein YhaH (DUF805 family)